MVRPGSSKIRRNDYGITITTLVEKSTLSLEAKTHLPSVLDFCGSLKMRTSSLYYWNEFAHVYLVPSLVTRHGRSLRESLDHDKDYHIPDGPARIYPKRTVEGQNSGHEPAEKTSINVLLVDDDQDILFTFKSILEAEGYHVEAFVDPNEALSHFTQTDPSYYNLVLTDIRMPNVNGFQLYRKLKEINTGIRVIFMTAFDVPGNLMDDMPAIKDSDIIKKPIEEEHFISRVKKAINLE
jgi:CheY-like chemotaxis protein